MTPLVIIPARMGGSRFPGRPLHKLPNGKPLVLAMLETLSERYPTYVASADDAVADAVPAAQFIRTTDAFANGTERVAHAAHIVDPAGRYAWVANVQGEFARLPGQMALEIHRDDDLVVTYATTLPDKPTPDHVRVVAAGRRAVFFTRAAVPDARMHLGIYVFRRPVLDLYAGTPECALERAERLEQMRLLHLGIPITLREHDCDGAVVLHRP